MGDTTCLMQPFCYASGLSNEANQNNPIHELGQSISFGRFMSESLSWEKWSSFSQNRYIEEAHRYSQPGSVAQKKAFFEAHYKKLAAQRAAALLEQQANDAASNNVTHQEHEPLPDKNHNVQTTSPKVKLVVNEKQDFKIPNPNRGQPIMMTTSETENQHPVGESVKIESESRLQNVDYQRETSEKVRGTSPLKTPILKQNYKSNKENLASMRDKKPPVSLSNLLKVTETSKSTSSPVKSAVSCGSKKDNFATPRSKEPALASPHPEKKRSSPKSLLMSNFTPIREINRLTASVMKRFENARVGAASSKVSKDNSSTTPIRTPTKDSKDEGQKHSSMTPLTENKRTKTHDDLSATGSKRLGSKWHLLSAEKKLRSPVISSPFSLRTEERAARRKKKLEEKFNASENQKVQLHTKLKEKANTEIRKLRKSLCFRASQPEFYHEIKEPKEETNESIMVVESPKHGTKAIQKNSLPPQKDSVKNNGINGGNPNHSHASNSRTKTRIHHQIFSMGTRTTDNTK